MRLVKTIFFVAIVAMLYANPSAAQTLTRSDGEGHLCASYTAPHSFTVPTGTISYYDFISNVGTYYKAWNSQFGRYDEKTNEYRPAPTVAFLLKDFFSVEFGAGKVGAVRLSIRADECEDLVLHQEDGKTQFIARISANLYFGGEEFVEPDHAGWIVSAFGKPFLETLARRDAKMLVIARPVGFSFLQYGDRMQNVELKFEIEDYKVLP